MREIRKIQVRVWRSLVIPWLFGWMDVKLHSSSMNGNWAESSPVSGAC